MDSPSSLTISAAMPGSGSVQEPGLVAVTPGIGVSTLAPVSVCHQVSTIGQRSLPITVWYHIHAVIGKERCPIVDPWWQTETGANVLTPIPGVTATKPGSCTLPLPGMDVDIVNEEGESITTANTGGYLVIRKPWPSMLRTIWGADE